MKRRIIAAVVAGLLIFTGCSAEYSVNGTAGGNAGDSAKPADTTAEDADPLADRAFDRVIYDAMTVPYMSLRAYGQPDPYKAERHPPARAHGRKAEPDRCADGAGNGRQPVPAMILWCPVRNRNRFRNRRHGHRQTSRLFFQSRLRPANQNACRAAWTSANQSIILSVPAAAGESKRVPVLISL